MERLTKYGNTTHKNGVCCTHFMSKECIAVYGNCSLGCKWEEEAWSKLAKYEDLEEQGLLIKLPFKVGDDVYFIPSKINYDLNVLSGLKECNRVYHQKIKRISIEDGHWYCICDKDAEYCTGNILVDIFFGKTWFLTKEEAEKAIAEMGE